MFPGPKHQNIQHFGPCVGNRIEVTGATILIIHSIIQFDRFVPVIDVGIGVKTIVAGGLGRKLFIRFTGCTLHVKLSMQLRLRDVIEIIVRAERIVRIIVHAQLRSAVRLHVRMVLACYMVRYKINNDLQAATVCALHQVFKFPHTLRNVLCQIRIHIIIIFYGIWRTGFTFYDSRMIGLDIVATIIRLRCMFYNTGIPYMGNPQLLYFS